YTASLQSVPAELYEAARVDGAGFLGRFRHVTLPMIAPGMTISVVLCLITTLKLYDVIAVLTGGGPAN
ncbi:ABC transporter permease subunit, partial [Streptomyces sp. SID5770]|uniref:carbohydrate ABC transporter permease n=2 Tax=Streptomyces TaxID=1883 RepID=UPI0013679C6C